MKRVYFANTLMEAQLAADTLSQLGIPNHIFNANAAGAVGELPFTQILPEVWIEDEDQESSALSALAAIDAKPDPAEKICPGCGESSPGNFLSCWKCGRALAS
jgi:hypothetical protein